MFRVSIVVVVAIVSASMYSTSVCRAGNNIGGAARLGWQQGVGVQDLTLPPSGPFPLFLNLQGAPDVRKLAVHLKWAPFDSLEGYVLVSSNPESARGYVQASIPGGPFAGDSSYTWSIIFPSSAQEKNCVVYTVMPPSGDQSVPAEFRLVSVQVEDSSGAVDDLLLEGNATVLGGFEDAPAVAVRSVEPKNLVAGQTATLTVHGDNFAPGAAVTLRAAGVGIQATSVQLLDPQSLRASVSVPDTTFETPLSIEVSLPDGGSGQLANAVSARQLWWGLWVDSTTVVSGVVGSGPRYRSAPTTATRTSPRGSVIEEEVVLTEVCHDVPFCTVPFNGTGEYSPSVSGPMPPQCIKQRTVTSGTTLTYFLCYSGPCTPSSPNKVLNLPVALEVYPRQLTGGHCHADDSRPTKVPARGEVVSGNTGPTGLGFAVDHTWPDPGGAVNGVFYSTSQDTFVVNADKDTTHIFCILVPGLIHMPEGPGYELVGATSRHPVGWYGAIEMVNALKALAVTVADSIPGLPPMGYNDMSLVWGGSFDLNGNWGPPHCSHRFGRGVDFRTRGLVPIPTTPNALGRRLRVLIRNVGFAEPYKESDHWHLNYTFPTGQ